MFLFLQNGLTLSFFQLSTTGGRRSREGLGECEWRDTCGSDVQSTALLRMGKGYHLVTLVASGSPLHSAPLQRSRLSPRQHADGKL